MKEAVQLSGLLRQSGRSHMDQMLATVKMYYGESLLNLTMEQWWL